jgi:hypothetical protein
MQAMSANEQALLQALRLALSRTPDASAGKHHAV